MNWECVHLQGFWAPLKGFGGDLRDRFRVGMVIVTISICQFLQIGGPIFGPCMRDPVLGLY